MNNFISFFKENKLYFFLIFLFLLHCLYYYPFLADDSLISLRYAKRFIEGKGLNWNDGEFIEGYSNFLWVILISILGFFGVDLIFAVRILGVFFSIATIIIIKKHFKEYPKVAVLYGILFLIFNASFAVWAIGGLEQPLVIFLVGAVIVSTFRIIDNPKIKSSWIKSAFFAGFLSITRPDGILFTILTALFLFFYFLKVKKKITNPYLPKILWFLIITFTFYFSLLSFRFWYYGEIVPNTALVKVNFSFKHFLRGIYYFTQFLLSVIIIVIPVLLLLIKLAWRGDAKSIYLLLLSSAWTIYIISIGGDIFPAFRLMEINVIIISISIIYTLEKINFLRNIINKKMFGTAIFVVYLLIQFSIVSSTNAKEQRWEFSGLKIGDTFKNTFPKNSLIAVTAAGAIPYSSEMRAVDMLGLNDYYLARNPPENFGSGYLAHELGDSNYIIYQRKPDIIIFSVGESSPFFPFSKEMLSNPDFQQNYTRKSFVLNVNDDNIRYMYINKYEIAGVKYYSDKIIIPHYLFTSKKPMIIKNRKFTTIIDDTINISIKEKENKNWKLDSSSGIKGKVIKDGNNIHISIFSHKKLEITEVKLIPIE